MVASPLFSVESLLARVQDPLIRIVDARFTLGKPKAGRTAFETGHIPGAVFVDLERDLSAPVRADRVGGRHPLPSPADLAAALSRLGITNEHQVVAYDDPSTGSGFYAAHFWWLLRYLGHDAARVSVLDGGLPAWLAAGGSLESGAVSPESAVYTPHANAAMLVDADAVANRGPEAVLIDSRAPERYRGDVEPLDWKAGHIPGAINRNWAEGIQADGHWRSAEEQAARFASEAGRDIIVYCGSGVSAGGNLLALELAGVPSEKIKLYAGSWSDWISGEPARPIEPAQK